MMTLKQAVEVRKCRTGEIDGTTRNGRFWLVWDPITIKDEGNGWDTPSETYALHLRHYEDGRVEAAVRREYEDSRNNIRGKTDFPIPSVLECDTIEDVVVELKKGVISEGFDEHHQERTSMEECYHDRFYKGLWDCLISLGLEESRPGPDE
jgi:hypothetical protein